MIRAGFFARTDRRSTLARVRPTKRLADGRIFGMARVRECQSASTRWRHTGRSHSNSVGWVGRAHWDLAILQLPRFSSGVAPVVDTRSVFQLSRCRARFPGKRVPPVSAPVACPSRVDALQHDEGLSVPDCRSDSRGRLFRHHEFNRCSYEYQPLHCPEGCVSRRHTDRRRSSDGLSG